MFLMLKSKDKEKGKSKKAKGRTLRGFRYYRGMLAFCLLPFAFFLSSCRRDMQDQPKSIAYRESTFFKDGNASRQLVDGTVPRGYLRADRAYYFGKKPGYGTGSSSDRVINQTGALAVPSVPANPAA